MAEDGSGAEDDVLQQVTGGTARAVVCQDGVASPKVNHLRNLSDQAVWMLSSAKPGFGVDQLRDASPETYWQSDGPQPHHVILEFFQTVHLVELHIYVDHRLDESYTPRDLCVSAGSCPLDMSGRVSFTLAEPAAGWVIVPLRSPTHAPIRCNVVQLSIIANHQNGRDTHLRGLRVFGADLPSWDQSFQSPGITYYAGLR